MTEQEAYALTPLALAYAGDAVFELYVRTRLIQSGMRVPQRLHAKAVSIVRAKAQADRLHAVHGMLTDREQDIVRRGRNAKSGSMPKSATMADYRASTGLEALFGYLHLSGQTERLDAVMAMIVDEI